MKEYIASVTYNGELKHINAEYPTKKAFYEDLRANGYSVRFISTEEKFDEDCEKYEQRCDASKLYHQVKNRLDKEYANEYGISVAHYRRAYKAWVKSNGYLTLKDCIETCK